jgi:hypothetical protein
MGVRRGQRRERRKRMGARREKTGERERERLWK